MRMSLDRSFLDRVVGAATLDRAAYDDIARDTGATPGAGLVVVMAALATGIAAAVDDGLTSIAVTLGAGVVSWLLSTLSAWYTGTELIRGRRPSVAFSEVLRVFGFAQAPGILAIAGVVPEVSGIVAAVIGIWTFLTSLTATRQVFDTSIPRAIAIVLVAFLVSIVIIVIASWILGTSAVFLV